MKVLLIDNYDSFVYNLVQYVGILGYDPIVYRNDKISIEDVRSVKPDRIVISPGPGTPEDIRYFGLCSKILLQISPEVPTLGVCLGHQGIGYVFGGRIRRAKRLMHGKTSRIVHDGHSLFKEVPNPFEATRYHSLVVDRDSLPTTLKVTATTLDDDEVMGIKHTRYPIEGVQFHPESIKTEYGITILKNFLEYG